MEIQFCTQCGSSVSYEIPTSDNLPRHVCKSCGFIHYQNPHIIAGCLVYRDDQVLLCKRAIEPRYGLWTIPAGFMENGETLREAAQRETLEESGAVVNASELFAIASLPRISQVYCVYLAQLAEDATFSDSRPESLEIRLMKQDDIPWDDIAFYTIHRALEHFYEDRANGRFLLHEFTY